MKKYKQLKFLVLIFAEIVTNTDSTEVYNSHLLKKVYKFYKLEIPNHIFF